jgi:mono/diheme cytochrome c family protein
MATFFQRLLTAVFFIFKHKWLLLGAVVGSLFLALGIGKLYQNWDDDPNRGAIAIQGGAFGESYTTPVYLEQGWSKSESLWFYNTTQGSGLLPYDFFLVLEQADSEDLFRTNLNIDKYRYLPQKPTFFNPDGLPVGLTKDTYQDKEYMGYTCAACHSSQVNFGEVAIRIDGGPAMADMVSFLTAMAHAMSTTLQNDDKKQRFVDSVLELNNDFDTEAEVLESLDQWTRTIQLYNTVNHSHIKYGYGRLDAFGRIYNRVLQHVINKQQLKNALQLVIGPTDKRILTNAQIDRVLEGIGENILGDSHFSLVLARLQQNDNGYPGLDLPDLLRVRNQIFNEPDAPVSYPFLWDISQSDYVQWNGLANNYGVGPLGRNTGEVIGVFGILDFESHKPSGFSLSAKLTGQEKKNEQVTFESSVDLINLQRLESQLKSLQSPLWSDAAKIIKESNLPAEEKAKWDIKKDKADRGQLIYAKYCLGCHEIIDRTNWDRIVVAQMAAVDFLGTDKQAAENSVNHKGKSGNLEDTVQDVAGVGSVIIQEDAPVVQLLTSMTKGVIATPDADKMFLRRWLDRLYVLGVSFFENEIPETIKSGNYKPDTTASPYNSLLAYKGRSLNGIWATAPYLHNGSVPTLYDLLLPQKRDGDPAEGEYRPDSFVVGSRQFNPEKVGFSYEGYDGFPMTTFRDGDKNGGHEYGAGRTPQMNGEQFRALSEDERRDLIEYIKTL